MTDARDQSIERVEAALREALRARRPGGAPPSLRERVRRVPVEAPTRRFHAVPFAQGLATAAVLILAVAGVLAIRLSTGGFGAPGPTTLLPAPTFDPTIVGPGLGVPEDSTGLWFIVTFAVLVLGTLASIQPVRWRRILVGLPVPVLIGWALVGAFAPISIRVTAYGPHHGLRHVDLPGPLQGDLEYVVGGPAATYAFGSLFHSEGPVPFTIEGLATQPVGSSSADFNPTPLAVWLDGDASNHGSRLGPGATFAPITLPADLRTLWFVYRAPNCALGPYGPTDEFKPEQTSSQDTVPLRINVLGWQRVIDAPIGGIIVTPMGRAGCVAGSPSLNP